MSELCATQMKTRENQGQLGSEAAGLFTIYSLLLQLSSHTSYGRAWAQL